jgi:hypothetical protein
VPEPAVDNGVTCSTIECMGHHRCEILIPLVYGRSGKAVTPKTLTEILPVFNRQFGGYTPLGLTSAPPGVNQGGFWEDGEVGESVEDRSFRVMVAVIANQLDTFRSVANAIGVLLEQKEMFIDIGAATVEFLKVHDSGETYFRNDLRDGAAKDAQKKKGDGTLGL